MIQSLHRFMQTRTFFWLRVGQFVLALGIFTFAALMPASYVATLKQSDHTLHFIGNLTLFLSASLACYGRLRVALLILFLIPYSLLIELAQSLAPSRTVDPHDMVFNIAGLCVGLIAVYIIMAAWKRLKNESWQKPTASSDKTA